MLWKDSAVGIRDFSSEHINFKAFFLFLANKRTLRGFKTISHQLIFIVQWSIQLFPSSFFFHILHLSGTFKAEEVTSIWLLYFPCKIISLQWGKFSEQALIKGFIAFLEHHLQLLQLEKTNQKPDSSWLTDLGYLFLYLTLRQR